MDFKRISDSTFDQVFTSWLECEVEKIEGRDLLPVAQVKGFTSIAEWRLATALRLKLDKRSWEKVELLRPYQLPEIIIGPYQGWSKFFINNLQTTFRQAMAIPKFFDWCKAHDRIPAIAQNFPKYTSLIVLKTQAGKWLHIEGGHRICAAALAEKIAQSIDFSNRKVFVYIGEALSADEELFRQILKAGTDNILPGYAA